MNLDMILRRSIPVGIVVLAFFLAASELQIRCQQTSATLSGRVEDTNGAIVNGATLIITNLETNQKLTSSSDGEGRYKFPYLQVGPYQLSVSAKGFAKFTRMLTVTVGQALTLPVRLEIEGLSERVTVTSEIPVIETVRTQLTETILPTDIGHLPLNGRNYLDLALLIPGVSPTNTGSNQRFAETSAVPGQGISVAGQRNLANSFVVDGLSANDDAADLTGTYFSQEVVREFQVITSGGVAEFGRAASGVVNIITQSGTNNWHGGLYAFFRNQRFDARNPLALRKDSLTQAQYGASIAGPLSRDRTFFFANFEQTRRQYSNVVTISTPAVTAINSRLNAVNYGGPRIETGIVPGSFDTTNFFGRVDHKINQNNQLTAHYSFYNITAANSRTVGGLNEVSRGSGLDARDQTIAVSNVTTLNSRTLNELRGQFTHSVLGAPINDTVGPAVGISGVANFGVATSSPLARDINLYEMVDNISTQRGAHSIKGGVDFLYNRVDIIFPGAIQGAYTFTSLTNFLSGTYSAFQQAFGAASQFQSNPNIGFFAQDEWKLRPNLTMNAGLRYDAQFLPQPIHTDSNNLAPRLGFAYAPGNRKTVFRASFGIYYDRVPLRATSNALQRDGSKYVVVQLAPTQAGAPVFPNVLASEPATFIIKPNITRIDPNIEASYSDQANLQVERELPGNASLSVGYLYLRGRHIIISRNLNVPTATASAGVPNLGRPDPNWGNISRYESSGDSYYNGMTVSFNKRAARWTSLRVSYTWSKAIDDTGNFFFSTPQNNFNVRDDQGLSDNDQRHRLVISGSLEAPQANGDSETRRLLHGFQLSYIFTYASRLPFNIVTGNDRNFDTNNNDRPLGVARNSGRGFDFASFDLRLARRFDLTEHVHLEVTAEGFNLFNRANLGIPNNTFGVGASPLPAFGQPTGAFDPRQFQFGLRMTF